MPEQSFDLTEQHIKLLRELVFEWDVGEAGVPIVFPDWMYGSADVGDDMLRILGFKDVMREKATLDRLNQELPHAFEIALQNSTLEVGRYSYIKISAPFDENDLAPTEETVIFDFTELHFKLLRGANGGWLDYAKTIGINSKRPYGDMTFYELDMARLLDVPVPYDAQKQPAFSKEQQATFDQLHQDLLHSVPVLLKYGTLLAGRYVRGSAYGPWRFDPETAE